ncbi:MAG: hypothetical protein IJN46_05095 [Lachnospiraceae bacterium]|nr:hypothetical protein [Lachnospiraceae bacterium]
MKKNQYTKRLSALLILIMIAIFSLTGCHEEAKPTETDEPTDEPTEDLSYLDAYTEYVQSILDANYHGDCTRYMQITGASQQQAAKMAEAHAVNLAEQIAELYAIQLKQIPAEIGERLTEVAYDVYEKAVYTVSDADKVGEKIYVSISVQPLKFYHGVAAQLEEYIEEFNARAKDGEFGHLTESEYENEYAKGVLEILEASTQSIETEDARDYRIQIRYNEETKVSYIAEEDLDAINRLILAKWEG